jgi:F-type H+-transporting ATPase subunit gamma
MANIKEIVERMHSVESMQQITKTMKLVAASKFNRAQQNLLDIRPYEQQLVEILNRTLNSSDAVLELEVVKKFTLRTQKNNLLIIAISADKGFCGAFNNNVNKKVMATYKQNINIYKHVDILPLGRKIYTFCKRSEMNIIDDFVDVMHTIDIDQIESMTDWIVSAFISEQYDNVIVVYNKFVNAASQVITAQQYLPIILNTTNDNTSVNEDYIFEPSQGKILETLIPFTLRTQMLHYVFESNASEQGSRMTNMSKATDNADALIKVLRIQYNQSRQAIITNEIIEISAGAKCVR